MKNIFRITFVLSILFMIGTVGRSDMLIEIGMQTMSTTEMTIKLIIGFIFMFFSGYYSELIQF